MRKNEITLESFNLYYLSFFMKKITLFIGFLFFMAVVEAQVYESPKLKDIKKEHKTLAFLPFQVVSKSSSLPKDMTEAQLAEEQERKGFEVQNSTYNYFLMRAGRKMNFSVTFQDVEKTNALLKKSEIDFENIKTIEKDSLCRLLGVDAVISGKLQTEKAMSVGGAYALKALTGIGFSTGEAEIEISIFGKEAGDLLWKYMHSMSASYYNKPDDLIDNLMNKASKKFPYKK